LLCVRSERAFYHDAVPLSASRTDPQPERTTRPSLSESDGERNSTNFANNQLLFDLLAEDSQLISNDVFGVKTHLLRSGRRSRLS